MSTEIAKPKLLERLGERYHIDPNKMLPTLKATAFRSKTAVSNEQMLALLVVADQYKLNPWTKEIYAFPDKFGGVIPVVGVDGWSRIINSDHNFDGMEFIYAEKIVENKEHRPCPEWIQCVIYRKDRSHPVSATEYLDECYRPSFKSKDGYDSSGPWQTHTKRFLRHKAMIQAARLAFGFVGIYDPDEAERIAEAETPRSPSVVAATIEESKVEADPAKVARYVAELRDAVFNQDDPAILDLMDEMNNDEKILAHRQLSSTDRSYIRNAINKAREENATTEQ